MDNSNSKKKKQLGMAFGTASARLKKAILFNLVQRLGLDLCHRCNEKIEKVDTFSTDHKVPWLDSEDPVGLFFDAENIAFSHLKCNTSVARKTTKKYFTKEEKQQAKRTLNATSMRKNYTRSKRQQKYKKTGW